MVSISLELINFWIGTIKIVLKYFWKNVLCSFEVENIQFVQYFKKYNCIPLPIILESKTKNDLAEKIKSLKNKLYLITCETLENPTIAKMLKKCMLKSDDFHNVLITMNPCCSSRLLYSDLFLNILKPCLNNYVHIILLKPFNLKSCLIWVEVGGGIYMIRPD